MKDNHVELKGRVISVTRPKFKDDNLESLKIQSRKQSENRISEFDFHQLLLSREFYRANYLTIEKAKFTGCELYFSGYLKSVNQLDSLGRIFHTSLVVVRNIEA